MTQEAKETTYALKRAIMEIRRKRFEESINRFWNSSPRVGKFDLAPLILNGEFNRYMSPDTDNAWIGFVLAEHLRGTEENEKPQAE